ncbi:lasso peptide biosynthesis B2 protein [Rahnella sp. ChDrAdgB13]|uniref:lasso peptide biosynthesis B2 protein n=1 Tax=Rahnella sp. ChDrAdgB13 TaxID=1850581 RepID=UPI001AD85B2A|nr:lasso peptide biosynthesis B2 protein [Rahnella sp. ChDrAdgB13]
MFVLNDNFKICRYSDDLIILNIINDSYSILENINIEAIRQINLSIFNNFNKLIDEGVLSNTDTQRCCSENVNFLEERWIKPTTRKTKTNLIKLLMTYIKIKKCERILIKKGFNGVMESLRRERRNIKYKQENLVFNESAMHHLNKAYPYSKNNSNCLTYSFCLASMLTRKNFNAKLIIGVRTKPFFSHAWVEINGVVINDDVEIRNKLSVIWEI